MSYTPNPFDLLGDDEDRPRRQTPKPPKQTSQPAPAKPQDAQQQKAAPAKPSPAPKKDDAKPKPQGDANKGKTDATAKKPAQPRQQTEKAPMAPRDPNYESEKPPRPTKDRRDGPNPRPIRKNGRQNDRLSGTGRAPNENKRRGAGSGNWGAVADGQEVAEAIKETQGEEKEEVVATGEAEAAAEPPKPEKELKGLDEYYESIKDKGPKVDQLKLRVAGEGVDQSAWAGYAPIKKDDQAPAQLSKKKGTKNASGKEEKPKEEKTKEEKVSIDKLFKVTVPPPQGIEERGQRGGRGGRGGKGPSRGGRSDRRPQTDRNKAGFEHDPQSFPALGGGAPASPAAAPAAAVPTPAVAAQANPAPAIKA